MRIKGIELSGCKITLIDGALKKDAIRKNHLFLKRQKYARTQRTLKNDHHPNLVHRPETGGFLHTDLGLALLKVVKKVCPDEEFHLNKIYVNRIKYGDVNLPHSDLPRKYLLKGISHLTILYYANSTWKREWGGETVFYDSDEGFHAAVSPRPGRIVIFRDDIVHMGCVPTRICPQDRFVLALKLLKTGGAR